LLILCFPERPAPDSAAAPSELAGIDFVLVGRLALALQGYQRVIEELRKGQAGTGA